jgi:acetyl esterase
VLVARELMEAEVSAEIGAELGEVAPEARLTHRNGYRPRPWETRVGEIELLIPRKRQGSYFPSFLEPRRRSEQAIVAVVLEAYVNGVSTRKVDRLVEQLGIEGMTKDRVSALCRALDEQVELFRQRPLEGAYPYLWLDAKQVKVRDHGRVVSKARARAARRPPGPQLFAVRDATTAGVPTRRYRPASERRPTLIYLHGGLWLLGDLDTHDRWCRRAALEAEIEVLAVEYRLAPEHPWPAAVEDACDVARAVLAASDRSVAIGGDSAGGCVAALVALALRDETESRQLAAQVLICPNTDLRGQHPSMIDKGNGFGLEAADVRWAAKQWVPDMARHGDGDVSPLCARDPSNLPPTVIVTAEDDPLRDEGNAYAHRLAAAGVPVTHRCERALPHGFIQGLDLESTRAAQAIDRLIADIRRLF